MQLSEYLKDRHTIILMLALVWVGLWGAWIMHPTVGLTQDFFTYTEWSTFTLDVRYGGLRIAPELLRMGGALGIVALLWSLQAVKPWLLRWAFRLIAIIPILILLPPYPQVLNLWWDQSYGLRFTAASLIVFGFVLAFLVDQFPHLVTPGVIVTALAAIGLATYGFFRLKPAFDAHYTYNLMPGWGSILFVLGLSIAVFLNVVQAWRQQKAES